MGSTLLCELPFAVDAGGELAAMRRRVGRDVLRRFADAAGLEVGHLGRIFDEFAGELATLQQDEWQELQEQLDAVAADAISHAADGLMAWAKAGGATGPRRARLRVVLVED